MGNEDNNSEASLPQIPPDETPEAKRRRQQLANLKPFVKGDPRINRKGRPKTFDEWRSLVQEILQEPAIETDQRGVPIPGGKLMLIQIPKIDGDGQPVVDENGRAVMVNHYATNAELLARKWLRTKDHQQGLVEAGFGKVPTAVDITSGGQSLVRQLPDDEKLRRLEALTRKALSNGEVIDARVIHSADEVGPTQIDPNSLHSATNVDAARPSSTAQEIAKDDGKS